MGRMKNLLSFLVLIPFFAPICEAQLQKYTEAGSAYVTLEAGTGTGAIGKLRDASAGGTDAGTMCLAVRNTSYSALVGSDGDYSPIGVNTYGAIFADLNAGIANSNSPVRFEDNAFGDGQGVMVAGSVREDTIANNTSTSGDVTNLKSNIFGALYVDNYGGGANGTSIASYISAASTNSTNVKSSG